MLVGCAFYFRYKSLPSPVSLADCDKYKKLNHSNQVYSSSHKLAVFCHCSAAAVIVLGLEASFLVVSFVVLSEVFKPFFLLNRGS